MMIHPEAAPLASTTAINRPAALTAHRAGTQPLLDEQLASGVHLTPRLLDANGRRRGRRMARPHLVGAGTATHDVIVECPPPGCRKAAPDGESGTR
jgi:hypothetical protein